MSVDMLASAVAARSLRVRDLGVLLVVGKKMQLPLLQAAERRHAAALALERPELYKRW